MLSSVGKEESDLNSTTETRTGYLPFNGTELYFETKGTGNPLLLIHAGVADRRMWEQQFEEFSRSHFVIRCDLRGFGLTRNPPGDFAHHEDIAALLRSLQVESARVVGASFGGSVAIDFAISHPGMVDALVLAAPALGGYDFASAAILDFFEAEEAAFERGDLDTATELNLRMWVDGFGRQPGTVSPDIREQVREMQFHIFLQAQQPGGNSKNLAPPAIDRLHEIAVPTLVLIGDHDAAEFLSIADLIARRIQNARLVTIPGAAHLPSMEKPGEFNRRVLEFLATLE